jgi:metal-responsive CopG/Arc/MetJ family transcriptional regulator
MTTQMITLKLEDSFLDNIDKIVTDDGYQSRTEFIRNAIREKIEESKIKKAIIDISRIKGVSKKKTTNKELESIRQKAFEEISKSIR